MAASATAIVSESNRPRPLTGLYVSLMLLLIWVPVPIGSNRPWSQGLLAMIALTLSGLWACSYARSPFEIPRAVCSSRAICYLLAAWALFPILQLLPLPSSAIDIVARELNGVELAMGNGGNSEFTTLSIDRNATFGGLLVQASLVSILFLTIALVSSRRRMKLLLVVLAGVGFLEAFYGLVLLFAAGDIGLWNPGHMPTTVSGTYVNQNHFAGMMELTIPVVIGLGLAEGGLQKPRSDLAGVTAFMLSRRGVLTFLLVIMVPALIMTTSRGAVISLVVAISGVLLLTVRRWSVSSYALRVGLMLSCLLLASVVWLDTGNFVEKVQVAGLESNRADLRDISFQMVLDNPIVGTGVGTYRWAFPVYKDERFGSGFYEHAHNDYLEILGEQGLLGFTLIFSAITLALYRIARACIRRRDPLIRGALFAGLAGCLSILIHGLVDFNLQIPANACYFFVLLGIGLAAANLDESNTHE